jgi:hypothetical protein
MHILPQQAAPMLKHDYADSAGSKPAKTDAEFYARFSEKLIFTSPLGARHLTLRIPHAISN